MELQNISILGLPASGKTSFIAALWAMMINNSDHCSLELETLSEGNQSYMNSIAESWLEFKDIGRTKLANNVGEVVMALKNKKTQKVFNLNIPDFYGELFDEHFKDREWSEEYHKLMVESKNFILFIDPYHQNNVARTIMHERDLVEQFADLFPVHKAPNSVLETSVDVSEENIDDNIIIKPLKIYKHINTSNQVKLVEILQYLIYTLNLDQPINLCVIVSKWDKVKENYPKASPKDIIEHNLPLLHQFLACNTSLLNFKIFGLSAQGVDYGNNAEILEFANRLPQDRIIVFDGNHESKDIAIPLSWLTE